MVLFLCSLLNMEQEQDNKNFIYANIVNKSKKTSTFASLKFNCFTYK